MSREPESDAERVARFVKPVGKLLTERADVLARIYAGVMAGGLGGEEHARLAVHDFLALIDGD